MRWTVAGNEGGIGRNQTVVRDASLRHACTLRRANDSLLGTQPSRSTSFQAGLSVCLADCVIAIISKVNFVLANQRSCLNVLGLPARRVLFLSSSVRVSVTVYIHAITQKLLMRNYWRDLLECVMIGLCVTSDL